MPDWGEHAVSLFLAAVAVILAMGGVVWWLVRQAWRLWQAGVQTREDSLTRSLDRIGSEVSEFRRELREDISGLRDEFSRSAADIFARLGAVERDGARTRARCEAIHGIVVRGEDDGK